MYKNIFLFTYVLDLSILCIGDVHFVFIPKNFIFSVTIINKILYNYIFYVIGYCKVIEFM